MENGNGFVCRHSTRKIRLLLVFANILLLFFFGFHFGCLKHFCCFRWCFFCYIFSYFYISCMNLYLAFYYVIWLWGLVLHNLNPYQFHHFYSIKLCYHSLFEWFRIYFVCISFCCFFSPYRYRAWHNLDRKKLVRSIRASKLSDGTHKKLDSTNLMNNGMWMNTFFGGAYCIPIDICMLSK